MFTGIGAQNVWHRTFTAKIGGPLPGTDQPAFFLMRSSKIVSVEEFTFFSSGSFHAILFDPPL